MKAKVLSIKLSVEKGNRIEVKEGVLLENFGLIGDAYAKPGDREVCLMSKMTTDRLSDFEEGLCVKRFIETILIDLDPEDISIGDVLMLGEAEVLITKKGKRCFPECVLIKQKKTCPLMTEAIFAKVIKGGKICVDKTL
ncbi:hypothetical protein EZV73_06560 [Acidaminobacter sp. JC074]|uniref:hypothetical protein n=1 Tax=Acidaminobacter sp. JC074 TaxID=2530199 RepID=UPI001F11661D|nr:hypothetical protein [Acidaminobacter sp. JC074]MCH4887224.1 hypothetical protein [Acidaminobacter sp. JC074]